MLQAKTARCAAIGAPRKKVPESERRRSSRLAIAPERLTYDWSDDEGPKRRSQSSRRARVRVVDELTDEQRAVLEGFNMDDFEASASASFTKPRPRRDCVITSSCTHRWMEPTLAELEELRRNCLGG